MGARYLSGRIVLFYFKCKTGKREVKQRSKESPGCTASDCAVLKSNVAPTYRNVARSGQSLYSEFAEN
jgi:hypothetical protein